MLVFNMMVYGLGRDWGQAHRTLRGGRVRCGYGAVMLLADEEGELGEVLEGDAGAASHSAQGVFGNVDLEFGLGGDALVEATEQ